MKFKRFLIDIFNCGGWGIFAHRQAVRHWCKNSFRQPEIVLSVLVGRRPTLRLSVSLCSP
ncbi:MAG: hypothetical protein IKI11_04280 [Neisseriaceae bacterium]|nr:hypothetical protein [Neisseriaceae bacterium]